MTGHMKTSTGDFDGITSSRTIYIVFVALTIILPCCHLSRSTMKNYAGKNWIDYAGDNTKSRYSTLEQINKQNVGQLKVAWTYRSGDFSQELKTTLECNPIVVNGIVYASTPTLQLV